jgi:hypothetical protein
MTTSQCLTCEADVPAASLWACDQVSRRSQCPVPVLALALHSPLRTAHASAHLQVCRSNSFISPTDTVNGPTMVTQCINCLVRTKPPV